MTDAFVIETRDRVAGIAIQDGRGFQFFASDALLWSLETRKFRSLRDLHLTIDAVIAERTQRARTARTHNTLRQRQRHLADALVPA